MTVSENVVLGLGRPFFLTPSKLNRRIANLASEIGLEIDPGARVRALSMGEKQRVEILKLLLRNSRVMIFDEPTAVLTPKEIEQLFQVMRRLASQGKSLVFISHKLDEVMSISDDISILRRGEIVDDLRAGSVTTKADLARRMVGREVLLDIQRTPVETRQIVLRIDALNGSVLRNIFLDLRQGEILAVVGVAGNGQKELVEIVCGLKAPAGGDLSILGRDWKRFHSNRDWGGNLAFIPEDRQGLATCRRLDLTDNFLLTTRHGFTSGPWLKRRSAEEKTRHLIREFDIRPSDHRMAARQLSGGNLQKLVLAREFFRRPRLIVAEQPTQGLDITATEGVWRLLLKARDRAGILLVTGDLAEALTLADRIAVIFRGRLVDLFHVREAEKVSQIGVMMAGLKLPPGSADTPPLPAAF
jgi:simple sugar transport system ATP-binding protein